KLVIGNDKNSKRFSIQLNKKRNKEKVMMQWSKTLLLGASLCAVTGISQAKQVMCVFDLVGKSGDVFSLMKDYQLAAKNWGADIELRVNTNEAVVAEDFKAG